MANPSPALTGLPADYGADIFESGTTQKFPLGAIGYGYGGNKAFRYGRNNASTASVAGNVQTSAAIAANHANIAVAEASAVNDLTVKVTLGATIMAKDLYAEGELCVNDVDGEGISYRIRGN